ncbi:InlB B-repeat-containing protein [Holdemanella porci]|uniref:InlB B-repeat-containing protein n=1 Tax=Holdemanella porci TaxID=2652276 RepID=UPI002FD9A428
MNAVEETVTEKDKEVDSAIALDITIVNADGIEIQPNGIVNVSFENVAVGGEEVNVYHVTDDASTVTEVATNTQSFDANHFSIYVITGEKKVELTTFNFVAEGNTVSTQIVKTGDTLITPTAPDIAGKAFVEWQENGSKFDGFGAQTITKTETRTITAKYEDALYVCFYNPEGTQIMRTEKVADHKDHDYSHVSYDVDATHKLVGWAADQNGTTNIAKNIAVPKGSTSVNVYAIIKEGYWVTFDSDGGSAIDSQFVFDKISLNDQTTPTKPGYTFDGWYKDSTPVENGATVTSPMTLKAHWKAAKVSYTVIHWWENADDDGYSFHESENKTGLTGTEANAKAKSYEGFTAQPVTKKTIRGDGSTIVSVYYKRNVYEVKFYSYSTPGFGWWDPGKPSKEYEDLKITAKYGQDISKKWPTYKGSSTWRTNDGSGAYQVNIGTMPLGGATFYGPKTGDEYETAYYYVEALPGEASDVTVSGIRYKLDHKDTSPGQGYYVTKEDQYPLTGFTFNEKSSTKIKGDYDNAKFYYTRNSYKIKFINKGKEDKSVEKKYEQSISSENYTPTRPSSLPEYYVFDGWYENELCEGEAYNFTGKKMPAQNVTLYAKWTAKKINLTYNLNNPEGTVDKDTKKVEAGTVASTVLPSIPTINEYSFAGWYYADGNGNITSEVFNTNNTITRDTSIVGKWLYKGELRVIYKPGSETGATVPTDGRVYAGGARVTVAKNATTTSGKKFLGWELNGNVYKPGQSFEVNKDIANKDNQIILTATWGNAETSTTLTYNPGNGRGNLQTVNVMNNEAVEIEAHGSLGFSAPVQEGKEYYFAGWADSKTGNATYADGQTINIDANGENVLYAVWVEKTEITLVANSGTRTYNGVEQSIEGFESTTMNGYTVSGLTAVTKGTNVGEYTNTVFDGTAKVEKDGVDVTDKVVVKTRAGKLVITPKSINTQEITVTKPADSKYDGNEHKNKPTVKDGEKVLVEDTDYTLSYSEDVINAGTVTVTIKGKGNYSQKTTVDYQITPRTVKLTSGSDSKTYDGTPLTKHEVKEDGFVKDDGATYDFTGSQTNVGTSDNTFTYNLKDGTLASNYIITTEAGKLTVNPVTDKVTVTIKEHSAEHVYDGTEKTVTGYDVKSISNKHYTKDDFTFSGTAEAKGTNVGEYPMNVQASDFTNNSHNFTNVTFIIEDGSLKITPKSIVPSETNGMEVTGPADTKYNGDEQKLTPVVKDQGKVLTENVDYKLSYIGDTTNVGTVKITIKGKGNYNGSTEVSYKITKRSVTLTSATDSKVYDKDPLTNHNVAVGGDGFVKEEGATYNVTGSQTSVGESDNEFTYTLKSNTKAENYNITTQNGKLIVTAEASEVTVVITGRNGTFPYDGTEKSVKGYDVSITQGSTYTEADFTFNGNAEVKGTEANTYPMGLKVSDFTNNNTNYSSVTFVVNDGSLVINPKSIIPDGPDTPDEKKTGIEVTKPADSKYDGNVHENKPEVKDTKTGATLVEGTDYTLSYKGDTTNAGTVTVTITGVGNYTGSHNVEYQITKRNVTLTSATASKVYDKTPLTNSNIAIGGDGFAKLEGASYNVTGSQTNVGNSNNEFTYKLNDDTKASNYNIEVKFGKLYITTQDGKVIVVITGHKATYDYDGTEKTVNGYDVSITEGSTYAEADFTFNGNAEVKATEANTYPMGLKASDFTNNNTNYSSVTFVVNDGSLVINPKSIIPDGPNTPDEKKTGIEVTNPEDSIYDGLPHVNPLTVTDTKTKTDLEENKDYTLSYSKDVINVGTVEVNVKGIGNYTGEFTKTYKITPKEYTVTTDSAKKVYDGTALTAGGKIEGIVDGEVVVVHTTGSQTEVGSTPNTYKLEWKKASSKNYKLKEDSIGTLTVTEQTIDPGKDPDNPNPNYSGVTINKPSNSVYDGKEHKWSPAVTDKEGNALVEGTDYTVEYSTSDFRNVTGTITVTITGIGNYTGTVTRTYEITPKAYTVTTESAKKVYDGTALTAGGKIESIVSGETVEFTTTGSRTVEGTSKNTYSLKWNGSAIQTNYKLAKESIGELTVKSKSIIPDEPSTPDDKKTGITVSDPKDSKYDGQEHREVLTVKDTKTGKDLIANKDYTVVYSDDLVNAGTVTIKVSGLGNYTGLFTKTYKITKRLVTLTSATVSKTYDGQALTNTSITVSGDGFVEGEGASYEVTGTQTSVGNSANAFEYKLNEKTLASNYDITKVVGTLTITAAPAPVTPPTSPTPVSPPPVTPRYIQQVVPALTPQEEVKKEKTPKAEPKEEKVEKVEKEKTPKARPEKFWALINLICAIVTVLFGLLLLISKRHKNKDDEEEDDETRQQTNNDDESKEQEKKRGAFTRVLAVLIAILSVVFFLVTEDLSLRWTWTDQWTIWMVVIGFVQIVVFFVGRKWKNVDDDEDEQAQQA